jgi:anthranilate phosphoribosyltransferase
MAEALVMLGVEKALVVHSEDGLDEISPCAPTRYACVEASQVTTGLLLPESFGLETLEESWILAGETVGENAAILRDAVSMREPRRSSAVVPNAAAALVLFGRAEDWREGAELAVRTMASGKAEAKLEELVEASAAA